MEGMECARGCTVMVAGEEAPVATDMGLLCQRCFDRLWWRLGDLPGVLEEAMHAVFPGSGTGERVAGTKDYDVLNSTALADVDELWAVLAEWAKWFALSTGVQRPAAVSALLADDRNVAGVSVRATPFEARRTAQEVVGWLQSHLEGFAYDSAVTVMHDAVVESATVLGYRYGLRERKLPYRRRACTVCPEGRISVSWVEDRLEVKCEYCWTEWPVSADELQEVLQHA